MLLFLLLVNHLEIEVVIILDDLFPVILLLQKHLTMFCRRVTSSVLMRWILTGPPKISLILCWHGSILNRFARSNRHHLLLPNFGSLRIEGGPLGCSLLCRVIFDWRLIYLLLVLFDVQTEVVLQSLDVIERNCSGFKFLSLRKRACRWHNLRLLMLLIDNLLIDFTHFFCLKLLMIVKLRRFGFVLLGSCLIHSTSNRRWWRICLHLQI